jgi:glucan phosphoethanolaminetransferase (alkaline phosphatase superfamily)
VAVSQRAAGAGVTTAWMFLGAGSMLFFVLFLRSRYLPDALARFGIFASALLVVVSVAMFVYPEHVGRLAAAGNAS